MKLVSAQGPRTVLEEPIHYLDGLEEGLVLAVELAEHIRHPVDHP